MSFTTYIFPGESIYPLQHEGPPHIPSTGVLHISITGEHHVTNTGVRLVPSAGVSHLRRHTRQSRSRLHDSALHRGDTRYDVTEYPTNHNRASSSDVQPSIYTKLISTAISNIRCYEQHGLSRPIHGYSCSQSILLTDES